MASNCENDLEGGKKMNAADLLDVQKTLILPILNHELHKDGQSNSQGINQTAAFLTRKNREALLVRMYISMEARGHLEPKYMNNYEYNYFQSTVQSFLHLFISQSITLCVTICPLSSSSLSVLC